MTCISLIARDNEHFEIFPSHFFFLLKALCSDLQDPYFECFFLSPLYILDINPLSDVQLAKILSHSVGFPFTPLAVFVFFFLSYMGASSSYGVLFRKSLSTFTSCRARLCFPLAVSVSHVFALRTLIHLKLDFMPSDKHASNFILLPMDNQFSQHHLLRCFLFFRVGFGHLCQILNGWGYVYTKRHANTDGEKAQQASALTKSYRRPNAQSGRNTLPQGRAHQTVIHELEREQERI